MRIKKLYATFGKLEGKTLELSSGLNIIYGKNEAGKSTWSAFIKAMFYGISTREMKKTGYIPDKEKYLPWSGDAMYGKMELETESGGMTIERTSPKSGIFVNVSATYDDSGKNAPLGEELIGVSANVYERTAFIRQSQIAVSSDKETERRILSIASSGDETVSAGEVNERLKKKQRELRYNKSGIIPALERETEALTLALSESETAEEEIARLSESIITFKAEETRLKRCLAISRAEKQKKTTDNIANARKALSDALSAAEAFENAPTRRELDLFIQKKSEWKSLMLSDEQNERFLQHTKDELSVTEAELADSSFVGLSEAEAVDEAEKACGILGAGKKKSAPLVALGCVLFALSALAILGGILVSPIAFAVAAMFLAAGVAVLIKGNKEKEKNDAADAVKEKYNVSDSSGIRKDAEKYISLLRRREELSKREFEATLAKAESEEKKQLRKADITAILSCFSIADEDLDVAEEKLRGIVEARENAQRDVLAARTRAEALDAVAEESVEQITYDAAEVPAEPPEFFENELVTVSEKIRTFELALAAKKASLSGFSRDEAQEKLAKLRERISRASFEYEALGIAIETVTSAEVELKNRFSPEVEKRTSEIFSFLTGGSFEIVRIKNSEFDVSVAKGEASPPHDGLMLSRGTLDELYFALRIALFETIIPADSAPPMILDDALVNFDDERAYRALSLLLEIAKTRQVILFSCHTREAKMLGENEDVRKIEL